MLDTWIGWGRRRLVRDRAGVIRPAATRRSKGRRWWMGLSLATGVPRSVTISSSPARTRSSLSGNTHEPLDAGVPELVDDDDLGVV